MHWIMGDPYDPEFTREENEAAQYTPDDAARVIATLRNIAPNAVVRQFS